MPKKKIKDMTREELRVYKNTKAAQYRANRPQKEAAEKYEAAITACKTVHDLWAVNRKKDADVVAPLQPQVELAAAQLYWVNDGWRFADDSDYVGLQEGIADLDRFVRDSGGLIKERKFKNEDLNEYEPGFAIWADFWRDAVMFDALVNENKPTEWYARYGLATSLFESVYTTFTTNIRRHRELRPVPSVFVAGWEDHVKHEGQNCWLCQFKRFHGRECEA